MDNIVNKRKNEKKRECKRNSKYWKRPKRIKWIQMD